MVAKACASGAYAGEQGRERMRDGVDAVQLLLLPGDVAAHRAQRHGRRALQLRGCCGENLVQRRHLIQVAGEEEGAVDEAAVALQLPHLVADHVGGRELDAGVPRRGRPTPLRRARTRACEGLLPGRAGRRDRPPCRRPCGRAGRGIVRDQSPLHCACTSRPPPGRAL